MKLQPDLDAIYLKDDEIQMLHLGNTKHLSLINKIAEGGTPVINEDLVKEWSPNNDRNPEEFMKSNTYRALWKCPICGGEYPYSINKREVGDDSCPYCNNRKVLPGFNSFLIRYSNLMKEWNYINNYLICNPDHIFGRYSKKVWWTCSTCGYQYDMPPKMRLYYQMRHKKSCPFCKGRRRNKHFLFK